MRPKDKFYWKLTCYYLLARRFYSRWLLWTTGFVVVAPRRNDLDGCPLGILVMWLPHVMWRLNHTGAKPWFRPPRGGILLDKRW